MAKILNAAGWRVILVLAALVLLAKPGAAQADPRDEVVVGVMHCAAITDSRQWLDCFYGAAQPMRAYLGLPPVPQYQQQLQQRYRSLSPAGTPSAPASPAGQKTASAAPPNGGLPPMPRERGLFSDFLGGDDIVTNEPLRDYSFNPDGTFVITLPDGQVWRQLAGDNQMHPAHWTGPASSLRVTISQGALNTFNMVVNGQERVRYKVSRLH